MPPFDIVRLSLIHPCFTIRENDFQEQSFWPFTAFSIAGVHTKLPTNCCCFGGEELPSLYPVSKGYVEKHYNELVIFCHQKAIYYIKLYIAQHAIFGFFHSFEKSQKEDH